MVGGCARAVAVTTATMVLVTVLGVSAAGPVSASPTAGAGSNLSEWAYGASRTYAFGPVPWYGHPGWFRQGNLTLGYSVILNQTNTAANASTFELSMERSMGVMFSVRYCMPSCVSPQEYLDIFYRQWEDSSSHANLTDQGTVESGGRAVSALAIANSSTELQGNLTNTYDWLLPGAGMMSTQMVEHSAVIYAQVASASEVAFAPALGLFPVNPSSASTWSAHSAFNASSSSGKTYFVRELSSASPTNWTLGPHTVLGGVNLTGELWLNGTVAPGSGMTWGGIQYPVLDLTMSGSLPFSVREGVILVPDAADLFGTSPEAWSANETGDALASMVALDARASADGHLGFGASRWQFVPSSTDMMDALATTGGLLPSVTPASDPVGSATYTLQGQPEPVADAQSQSSCVTTGLGCPTGSVASPLRKMLFELVVGGVAATVVAALLVVLVAERRRLPPPTYPNAQLYPPGAAAGPTAGKTRDPRPEPPREPPPEEDPLDHLW